MLEFKKRDFIFLILIFLAVFFCYNLTSTSNLIPSGDVVPATLLPYSILNGNGLYFDYFSDNIEANPGLQYAFSKTADGHYVSFFPIVTPLLVTPVYAALTLLYQILGVSITISDMALFGKISASVICAMSAVVLYSVMQRLVSDNAALVSVAIYALGTSTWAISGQALWQHGVSELLILLLVYLVFRDHESPAPWNVALMGLCAALLVFNRPPDAVFVLPALVYAVTTRSRTRVAAGLIGFAVAGLPFLAYNAWAFGTIFGGYSGNIPALGAFDPLAVLSLIVAPQIGFFIFCPVLILGLYGGMYLLYARIHEEWNRFHVDHILLMGVAAFASLLFYGFYTLWYTGSTFVYGNRFLTGAIPVLVILAGMLIEIFVVRRKGRIFQVIVPLAIALSIVIQLAGVVCYPYLDDSAKTVTKDEIWSHDDNAFLPTDSLNRVEFINIYSVPPLPSVVYWRFR